MILAPRYLSRSFQSSRYSRARVSPMQFEFPVDTRVLQFIYVTRKTVVTITAWTKSTEYNKFFPLSLSLSLTHSLLSLSLSLSLSSLFLSFFQFHRAFPVFTRFFSSIDQFVATWKAIV